MIDNHCCCFFISHSVIISTYRLSFCCCFFYIDVLLICIWPLCNLCKHCVFDNHHCFVISEGRIWNLMLCMHHLIKRSTMSYDKSPSATTQLPFEWAFIKIRDLLHSESTKFNQLMLPGYLSIVWWHNILLSGTFDLRQHLDIYLYFNYNHEWTLRVEIFVRLFAIVHCTVAKSLSCYKHGHSQTSCAFIPIKTPEPLPFSSSHMFSPAKQCQQREERASMLNTGALLASICSKLCLSDPFTRSFLRPLTRPQIRGQWLLRQSLAH